MLAQLSKRKAVLAPSAPAKQKREPKTPPWARKARIAQQQAKEEASAQEAQEEVLKAQEEEVKALSPVVPAATC